MAFPLIKVVALVAKSASKPIARRIKNQTTTVNVKSPAFQAFVVKGARLWHKMEGKIQSFAGDKTPRKQLNISAAVDLGAEVASEGFLILVALALLSIEAVRSGVKDKAKAEELNNEFESMRSEINTLRTQIEIYTKKQQDKTIKNHIVDALENKS
ncbi:hypothetical protein AKO1_012763 [Acrasis kona]|uniref:OPA3-like protein n=1 Tax=Acrasis kona TaxID=1008807 RepID=A0AAW2YW47_9EUKA